MTQRQSDYRANWRWVVTFVVIAAGLFVLACIVDQSVFRYVKANRPFTTFPSYRGAGTVYVWFVVAIGLLLVDRGRLAGRPVRDVAQRAVLLSLSVTLGGLLVNLLKVVIRRERPDLNFDHYVFRPWSQNTLSTVDLGLPSGHTAVAFAAAFMLSQMHPRGGPVWYAIAVFCAANRVGTGDHFLSDAIAAAFVGCASGWVIWRWHMFNERKRSASESGADAPTSEK